MTNTANTTFEAALAAELEREAKREAQRDELWRMTAAEREAAMWRGGLSYFQLQEWSVRAAHEVPRIATDLTAPGEPGEFAWIVMQTPEWAEASE